MRNARTKSTTYRRRGRKTTKTAMYRDPDSIGVANLEVGYYHNLIDYQNDARDLFSLMNSSSNDWSQYRDIYSQFKLVSVVFTVIPALLNSAVISDSAMGLFALRQGIFEASPSSQSVSTVLQYPGTLPLHNMKEGNYKFSLYPTNFFSNTDVNAANTTVPKVTYYAAWYKIATTNTAQAIVQVRVRIQARGKLI